MASTLTASSTDAQVIAAYDDNASYEEDASASKARAFITAVRILLRRIAKRSRGMDFEFETDPAQLRSELQEARAWLAVNGDSGEMIHPDFSNFRL